MASNFSWSSRSGSIPTRTSQFCRWGRELIRFANAESGSKHTHRLCAPSFNARVVPPIPAPTSRTSPTKYGRSWDWTYDFQLFACAKISSSEPMYWKSDMSAGLSFQIVRTVRHWNKIGWPAFVKQQGHKLDGKEKIMEKRPSYPNIRST